MDDEVKKNISDTSVWQRGLFMMLFVMVLWAAKFVLLVVVFIQFLVVLFSGEKNEQLLSFGGSLSRYLLQVSMFLTYNQDEKPFPFERWPTEDGAD